MTRAMKPIPISAAERIAKSYGYDQVIILARRVGEDPDPCGDHLTTYGRNKAHCSAAARIGDFLKFKAWDGPKKMKADQCLTPLCTEMAAPAQLASCAAKQPAQTRFSAFHPTRPATLAQAPGASPSPNAKSTTCSWLRPAHTTGTKNNTPEQARKKAIKP